MDFRLSEDLRELQALAVQMFAELAPTERVREVEAGETGLDDVLWRELGKAGLLGLALPEEHDGAGLGLDAACVVLEEQGRHVAPVPVWSHVVGSLVLARHGAPEVLAGLADGSVRVLLALEEYDGARPAYPRTTATANPSGDGSWTLTGEKAAVPTPEGAALVLVSATDAEGPALFLVENDGLRWEPALTTTHDRAANLALDGTRATRLGGVDVLGEVLRWSALALTAVQVGVADGAMRLASGYVSERRQFGRPLGSFQAVQHQLADCWIDVDAMRVTLWQGLESDAAARDDRGAADRAALVAKWWCDQAGLDVVHRVQHVHGGIGVDVDYPVHRHFLWGKQVASTLGGAEAALADLGDLVAAEDVVS